MRLLLKTTCKQFTEPSATDYVQLHDYLLKKSFSYMLCSLPVGQFMGICHLLLNFYFLNGPKNIRTWWYVVLYWISDWQFIFLISDRATALICILATDATPYKWNFVNAILCMYLMCPSFKDEWAIPSHWGNNKNGVL